MRWHDDADPSRASSADLLLSSMISNLRKSRSYTKDTEGYRRFETKRVVVQPTAVARIYIAQEGEKIDFARGVNLESEMEAEQHSGNSGDG